MKFLMHRVELKAQATEEKKVPLSPAFLMHRVELKANSFFVKLARSMAFLMHRVELKATLFLAEGGGAALCS